MAVQPAQPTAHTHACCTAAARAPLGKHAMSAGGAGNLPMPLSGTSASDATAEEPLLLRALPVLLANLLSHAPARLGWPANPSLTIQEDHQKERSLKPALDALKEAYVRGQLARLISRMACVCTSARAAADAAFAAVAREARASQSVAVHAVAEVLHETAALRKCSVQQGLIAACADEATPTIMRLPAGIVTSWVQWRHQIERMAVATARMVAMEMSDELKASNLYNKALENLHRADLRDLYGALVYRSQAAKLLAEFHENGIRIVENA
jgi:hypothetical protein